jgi:hypothetical protein
VVSIYLLENGTYGKPIVQELEGTTGAAILPQVVVDWVRVLRED